MITANDILNARILIVDDQEANVVLLEQTLRRAGYAAITSTRDPSEVCELHLVNSFSLILLDLQMPGMDGFQVMENLKALEADSYLPVLVITAQPEQKLRALKAGAKDFISKPFDLAEVVIRVHNMLEVRLLHEETKRLYEQVLAEKKVSERLLLTALPDSIVEHLKGRPLVSDGHFAHLVTEGFAEVTVVFADLLEFTRFAEGASAEVLLGVLGELRRRFGGSPGSSKPDREKVVGDAYLASIGLSEALTVRTIRATEKALDLVEALDAFNAHSRYKLLLRIGMDSSLVSNNLVDLGAPSHGA